MKDNSTNGPPRPSLATGHLCGGDFHFPGNGQFERLAQSFPWRAIFPTARLGNKIDIPTAASEDELRNALGPADSALAVLAGLLPCPAGTAGSSELHSRVASRGSRHVRSLTPDKDKKLRDTPTAGFTARRIYAFMPQRLDSGPTTQYVPAEAVGGSVVFLLDPGWAGRLRGIEFQLTVDLCILKFGVFICPVAGRRLQRVLLFESWMASR